MGILVLGEMHKVYVRPGQPKSDLHLKHQSTAHGKRLYDAFDAKPRQPTRSRDRGLARACMGP